MTLVASPDEKRTIDTMQATMAVVEGYAEHVMDAVGEPLLPGLPRLRRSLDARRKTQSTPSRLMMKLLGMEMKMRQYQQGKAFCDAVVQSRRDRGAQPRLAQRRGHADAGRDRGSARLAAANGRSTGAHRLNVRSHTSAV